MILGEDNKKPNIKYPCVWTYKIIGEDVDKMIESVEKNVNNKKYDLVPSNVSKNNKYFSISLKMSIISDEERQRYFEILQGSEHIKIVL